MDLPAMPSNLTLRQYQSAIARKTFESNVLVLLETGKGKTLIACHSIKYWADKWQLSSVNKHKKIFVLAPNKELVKQHGKYISEHTGLRVTELFGCSNKVVNIGKLQYWRNMDCEVLIMTPEICRRILHHALFILSDLVGIVFDEAHHSEKSSLYRVILKFIGEDYDAKYRQHLRILGLAPSLANQANLTEKKCEKRVSSLKKLMFIDHIEMDKDESEQYGATPPPVIWEYYTEDPFQSVIYLQVKDFIASLEKACELTSEKSDLVQLDINRNLKFLLGSMKHTILEVWKSFGIYALNIMLDQIEKRLRAFQNRAFLHKNHEKVWKAIGQRFCEIHTLVKSRISFESFYRDHTSRKFQQMMDRIGKQFGTSNEAKNDLRAIVFVLMRNSAFVMYKILLQLSKTPQFSYLKPGFIVGSNQSVPLIQNADEDLFEMNEFETRKNNSLEKFRRGEVNILVSTAICEEGIDVPRCNLVVRYDIPPTPRNDCQSRGRGRLKNAVYALMVSSNDGGMERDRVENNWLSHALMDQVVSKTMHLPHGNEADDDDEDEEDLISTLSTRKGAQINIWSAPSILLQYLNAKLLNNKEKWTITEIPLFQAYSSGKLCLVKSELECIRTTPQKCTCQNAFSCVLTISGVGVAGGDKYFGNKNIAKKYAWYKMCCNLYYAKKLDENLLAV